MFTHFQISKLSSIASQKYHDSSEMIKYIVCANVNLEICLFE
jgi:hypothetical protein